MTALLAGVPGRLPDPYKLPDPYVGATGPVEWFHHDVILPTWQFEQEPRIVDYRLDFCELEVVNAMWKKGYIPSKPQWSMWVELQPFGDGEWCAHARVTIQGVHRSAV